MIEETVGTEDRKPVWSGSRLSSHARVAAVDANNRGEMKPDKFSLAVSSDISGAGPRLARYELFSKFTCCWVVYLPLRTASISQQAWRGSVLARVGTEYAETTSMADADEEKRKAAMAACQEMQNLCVQLCISPPSAHH